MTDRMTEDFPRINPVFSYKPKAHVIHLSAVGWSCNVALWVEVRDF